MRAEVDSSTAVKRSSGTCNNNQNSTLVEFIKNYKFDYESMIDDENARKDFENYLIKIKNQEIVHFIRAVEVFKMLKSCENRYRDATAIINTHILGEDVNQINISNEYKNALLDKFSKQSASSCTKDLFDSCLDRVQMQLKQDSFPRYVESQEFLEFLKNQLKKEGTKCFKRYGVTKVSINIEESIEADLSTDELLSEADKSDSEDIVPENNSKSKMLEKFNLYLGKHYNLEAPYCTKDDVDFMLWMYSTFEDDKMKNLVYSPVQENASYSSYICKKAFNVGMNKKSAFIIQEMVLPFSLQEMFEWHTKVSVFLEIDSNTYSMEPVAFQHSDKEKGHLSNSVTFEKYKLGFPFDNRYSVMMSAAIDDTKKNNQYIVLKKSCRYVNHGTVVADKKLVKSEFFGIRIYKGIDAHKMKYVEATICNLSSPIPSSLAAKMGAKRVGKLYSKIMTNLRDSVAGKSSTKPYKFHGNVPLELKDECFGLNRSMKENEALFI